MHDIRNLEPQIRSFTPRDQAKRDQITHLSGYLPAGFDFMRRRYSDDVDLGGPFEPGVVRAYRMINGGLGMRAHAMQVSDDGQILAMHPAVALYLFFAWALRPAR